MDPFARAWRRLERLHQVDGLGGAQYTRAHRSWARHGRPGQATRFLFWWLLHDLCRLNAARRRFIRRRFGPDGKFPGERPAVAGDVAPPQERPAT